MSPAPAPVERHVILWAQPPSRRYRTYVDPPTNRPLAFDLSTVPHPPRLIFDTPEPFLRWESDGDPYVPDTAPQPAVALSTQLATQLLGWDPIPETP